MSSLALSRNARRNIAHSLSYVFLVTVGLTMVFPLAWMLLTSVKTPGSDVMDLGRLLPELPWRVLDSDIRDWPALCRALSGAGPVGHRAGLRKIAGLMGQEDRDVIASVVAGGDCGEHAVDPAEAVARR